MEKINEPVIFLEALGDNPTNRVIIFLLSHASMDYTIKELAASICISRQVISIVMKRLLRFNIVRISRSVGGAKMWCFDLLHPPGIRLHNLNKALVDVIVAEEMTRGGIPENGPVEDVKEFLSEIHSL